MFACSNGHTDVVQLLLDKSEINIDLNARDNDGRTALRKIDLNARNRWRETAFIYACIHGHKDIVKLLVQHSKTKGIVTMCHEE